MGRSNLNSRRVAIAAMVGVFAAWVGSTAHAQAPTTINDFFAPGTQPGTLTTPIQAISRCSGCHGGYDEIHEPYRPWAASAMGQAMRDPIFRACLTVAEQDVAFVGDVCLRCHTPGGWLAGRSTPTDGSALLDIDYEGISCNFCHRMVDPWQHGINPPDDADILANLPDFPVIEGNGSFVVDPEDRRRGPFDLDNFNSHEWRMSDYYPDSSNCGMCHDVSNPAFDAQPDGTYVLNDLDMPHPTQNKYDMFPIERTYSEWTASAFAQGAIEMGGRFGGNITAVSSCQDCHMPDGTGRGCNRSSRPIRDNLPTHYFNGGNTWMVQAVRNLYPDDNATGLTDASVADSIARAEQMLRAASDLDIWQDGGDVVARVTNMSGHKLPSGYPEGRRVWVNVRFYDGGDQLLGEHGAYDVGTATLDTASTTVYETKIGVDDVMGGITGLPIGPTFHFAVNNVVYKDNRIPPMGFTNAGFEAVQAAPVGHPYADGQYWDDSIYPIPAGAVRADVRVFYQLSSRDYIEFLRDANMTNDDGDVLYAQWLATGMSSPVEMDFATLALVTQGGCNPADIAEPYNVLDLQDIGAFISGFLAHDPIADLSGDGVFDLADINIFVTSFIAGCP
ncbi:MAG: hypothetical protein H6810_08840 [Phycisphaeraceae bacterium]|nr:MAG: hypothetical protein H6810_08840 [Phycisphaeraceae bacterium]